MARGNNPSDSDPSRTFYWVEEREGTINGKSSIYNNGEALTLTSVSICSRSSELTIISTSSVPALEPNWCTAVVQP